MKNILKTLVSRKELAAVAMGHIKADKVIKNGNLIDVYTGKIRRADIAIKGERIALVGNAGHTIGAETQVIDAGGYYLSPGLMDAHIPIAVFDCNGLNISCYNNKILSYHSI